MLAITLAFFSDVLVLSADNFSATIDKLGAKYLVEFYAPWCGHCKKLSPEFEEAARLLAEQAERDPAMMARLAKVDATEHTALADAHGVINYPTLKWFHRGRGTEYSGGRTAVEIVEWVARRGGEPLKTLPDEAAVAAFVLASPVAAVAYLPAAIEVFTPKVVEALTALAERVPSVPMGRAHHADRPRLVLSRAFDEPNVTYAGSLTDLPALQRFIAAESLPLVVKFSEATQQQLFSDARPLQAALLHLAFESEQLEQARRAFRSAAARLRGECVFATVDTERHPELLEFFDLEPEALPALVVLHKEANRRYPLHAPPTDEAIIEGHVRNVLAGDAVPSLRSQPPPHGRDVLDGDGVRVLVGSTYEQTVLRAAAHHTALMVYAPWCSRSKRLATQWTSLARRYLKDDALLVAKLDASANELRHPEVLDLPKVLFFPANATRLSAAVEFTELLDARPDVDQLAARIERMREAERPGAQGGRPGEGEKVEEESGSPHEEIEEPGTKDEL